MKVMGGNIRKNNFIKSIKNTNTKTNSQKINQYITPKQMSQRLPIAIA